MSVWNEQVGGIYKTTWKDAHDGAHASTFLRYGHPFFCLSMAQQQK
jgi:hypothetical protein